MTTNVADLVADVRAHAPGLAIAVEGDPTTPIAGLAYDSRRVAPGDLFFCVPGEHADGHAFAGEATAAGAHALVMERPLEDGALAPRAAIRVEHARPAMAHLAAAFYRHPSSTLRLIGVTGTNGKTTTVHLIESVLTHAGEDVASIGTLTGVRTTPEAPDLQRRFRELVEFGVGTVAMEVSSHALVQDRVTGNRFSVGVFTNLSPDHLDYHDDLDDYFLAKARLFRPDVIDAAVINGDDEYGQRLADMVDVPVTLFRRSDIEIVDMTMRGSELRWRDQAISLALPGLFNIDNAHAAATALAACGVDEAAVADGLSAADAVPGRFEVVRGGDDGPVVVVTTHTLLMGSRRCSTRCGPSRLMRRSRSSSAAVAIGTRRSVRSWPQRPKPPQIASSSPLTTRARKIRWRSSTMPAPGCARRATR